jgi:glycosyltransferase involved in cell wall biosynthesis
MKELTLAIPNFNGGKYLAQTLGSLVQQGSGVRWYLQDGLSTDNSLEIAGRFCRAGDIIVQEKDAGQTDALNRAFSRMGGDIVGFINSDDCLVAGAAFHILKFFEDPEIDLVVGEIRYVDGNGTAIGKHAGRIDSLEEILNLFDVWFQKRQWVQPEVFFRRRMWEKVGPFNTSYHYAFDYDYWVRCFRVGARIQKINHILTEFRLHPEQKSTNATAAAGELLCIARKHLVESREISQGYRWTMLGRIDYALRQRELTVAQNTAGRFFCDLCRHPSWLLGRECRERLGISLRRRLLPGERQPSP